MMKLSHIYYFTKEQIDVLLESRAEERINIIKEITSNQLIGFFDLESTKGEFLKAIEKIKDSKNNNVVKNKKKHK